MPAEIHRPAHPVRFVTAASLFDGHDASINIMRRILQSQGAEVIHLGHNRAVEEIVAAVVQEDTNGVAVSSYQGGHMEYFKYLVDELAERGYGHVKVYGGGGGTIVAPEIRELEANGVEKIFSPEDGQRLGLAPMINTMIKACDVDLAAAGFGVSPKGTAPESLDEVLAGEQRALARLITVLEAGRL
ncbi:MAG TPA: cobalamin-dependent protein, partial [Acidimicrobiia bacterium]|nr:cobalamin-dependent protein [Acidimicrobiia bacterium]